MRTAMVLALSFSLIAASPSLGPKIFFIDPRPRERGSGTGLWRPNQIEAADAISALRRYVKRDSTPSDLTIFERGWRQEVARGFEGYTIQIMGVRQRTGPMIYETEGNGPKQIYMNGFCPSAAENMRLDRDAGIVADGESCFFSAIFDLASRRIIRFRTNGTG